MLNDQTPIEGTDEKETATPQEQVEETTENPSEEVESEESAETEEEDSTPEETPDEQPSPEEPQTDPYREKFVNSAREAMLLNERNKVKEAQLEQLTKIDTPTDDAMRQVYTDWDDLNEVTKKALIKQEAQEMRQRRIEAQQSDILARMELNDKLDTVIESNPKLAGKETEFKRFAQNPKNKGIDAEVLAKAFLFDVEEETPSNVQKEEVLPQGSGGSREPLKPNKVSIEEASKIRETDYSKYLELVKNDMIEEIE